jgi:ribonuclease HI
MPWIEAKLRGQKVYARARSDGTLAADGGRVEIRYKPNDGRAYRAGAANLEVEPGSPLLPDETCVPADAAQPAQPATSSRGGGVAAPPTQKTDRWIAYTDGACSGNPGPAGAGFVLIAPGGKIHEGYEFLGTATNNVGELTAILRAVEALPENVTQPLVHTDSQYAIGVLTKGWKAKVNQELIAKTKELVSARKAALKYVPGHAGVPMNERADELAREAITRRTSKPIRIA